MHPFVSLCSPKGLSFVLQYKADPPPLKPDVVHPVPPKSIECPPPAPTVKPPLLNLKPGPVIVPEPSKVSWLAFNVLWSIVQPPIFPSTLAVIFSKVADAS